jgi:hypothetical protein
LLRRALLGDPAVRQVGDDVVLCQLLVAAQKAVSHADADGLQPERVVHIWGTATGSRPRLRSSALKMRPCLSSSEPCRTIFGARSRCGLGTSAAILLFSQPCASSLVLPPSLFEHPAAELSVDDSAQLGEDRRQPDHIA